jgi:intein/homing endonuclease
MSARSYGVEDLKIIGYHIAPNIIANSDAETIQSSPWLDFLFADKGECIKVLYHMDYSIACLLKMIHLPKKACKELAETTDLEYKGYTFQYMPKKWFAIKDKSTRQWAGFSDMSQYTDCALDMEYSTVTCAISAKETGEKVYQSLHKLGLHPKSLTSPISAFNKEVLSTIDLPTVDDLPDEVAQYAYNCCHGSWIECFKIGHFSDTLDFDIRSAYGSELAKLIDFRYGTWKQSKKYMPAALYGYCKGEVTIDKPFSPILYKSNSQLYTPTGSWETYLTKKEIDFIWENKLGTFEIDDSWWWIPNKDIAQFNNLMPLGNTIDNLYTKKQQASNNFEDNIIKRIMCFSPDTNIWTEKGVKKVTEVEIGEKVYSVSPKTGEVSLEFVEATQKYHFSGDLIHLQNERHDFLITPEHHLLLKKDSRNYYQWLNAKDLLNRRENTRWAFPRFSPITGKYRENTSLWQHLEPTDIIAVQPNKKWASTFEKDANFRFIGNGRGYITEKQHIKEPSTFEQEKDCKVYAKNGNKGHRVGWRYKTNDLLELMGWYISEGCTQQSDKSKTKGIGISNQNPKNLENISHLLSRMGIGHHMHKDGTDIASITIYRFMQKECGEKSTGKHIPNWVFELDHTHLAHLYQSLMDGDGSWHRPRQMDKYTTISKQLATDFQRLCIHLGFKSRITDDEFTDTGKRKYRVFMYSKERTTNTWRKNTSLENYSGEVYCITVSDNHTVLAGRNNKLEFIGQSGTWGKMEEYNEKGFGELFNPVWCAQTEVGVRLRVADFILSNNLQDDLLSIIVDGILIKNNDQAIHLFLSQFAGSPDQLSATENSRALGSWKLSHHCPSIIISSGTQTLRDKKSTALFSLQYDWLVQQIEKKPKAKKYSLSGLSPVTLHKALKDNRLQDLGKLEKIKRTISLNSELKRCYKTQPKNGRELLARQYTSEPWDISIVQERTLNEEIE